MYLHRMNDGNSNDCRRLEPDSHDESGPGLTIDTNHCAGCGICRRILPNLIDSDGFTARIRPDSETLIHGNEILQRRVSEAVISCPCGALHGPTPSDSAETAQKH